MVSQSSLDEEQTYFSASGKITDLIGSPSQQQIDISTTNNHLQILQEKIKRDPTLVNDPVFMQQLVMAYSTASAIMKPASTSSPNEPRPHSLANNSPLASISVVTGVSNAVEGVSPKPVVPSTNVHDEKNKYIHNFKKKKATQISNENEKAKHEEKIKAPDQAVAMSVESRDSQMKTASIDDTKQENKTEEITDGQVQFASEDDKLRQKREQARQAIVQLKHTVQMSLAGKELEMKIASLEHALENDETDEDENDGNEPAAIGQINAPDTIESKHQSKQSQISDIVQLQDNGEDQTDTPTQDYDYDVIGVFLFVCLSSYLSYKALNIVVLSPSRKLRRRFVHLLMPDEQIKQSKTAMSVQRFERDLSCGPKDFVLRVLEMHEFTFLPDLFDNDNAHLIVMIFSFDTTEINANEKKFMEELAQWMETSGHWPAFWKRTLRLLDYALNDSKEKKDNGIETVDDYFLYVKDRADELDKLFEEHGAILDQQSLKWTYIDADTNSNLTFQKQRSFKWPYLPVQGAGQGQDWRVQMMLKLFTILDEPHRSYFLASALSTPNKNLMPKNFEEMAKKTVQNGPNVLSRGSISNKSGGETSSTRNLQAPLNNDNKRNSLPKTQPAMAEQKRHTIAAKPDLEQTRKAQKLQAQQNKTVALQKVLSQNSQDGPSSVPSLVQTKSPSDVIAPMAEENLFQQDEDKSRELKSHQIAFGNLQKKSSKHSEKDKGSLRQQTSNSSGTPQSQAQTPSPAETPPMDIVPPYEPKKKKSISSTKVKKMIPEKLVLNRKRHSSDITPPESEHENESMEKDETVTPPAEDETRPRLAWEDSKSVDTPDQHDNDIVRPSGRKVFVETDTLAQKSMLRFEAYTAIDPNEPMAYTEYGAHIGGGFHRMDVSFDDNGDLALAPGQIANVHAYNDDDEDAYVRPEVFKHLDEIPKSSQFLRDAHNMQSKRKHIVLNIFLSFGYYDQHIHDFAEDKEDTDSDDDIDPMLDIEHVKRQTLNQDDYKFVEKQRQVSMMRMQDIIEKSRAGIEHFRLESQADASQNNLRSILLSPNTRVISGPKTNMTKNGNNDNPSTMQHNRKASGSYSSEQQKTFFNGDESPQGNEASASGPPEPAKIQMSFETKNINNIFK
ncbi:hypothetical protein RFI_03420 [Reticulomyxa filosa]|uniref:Uncharacterized protein n=1 Tax=Reticulomyxa filosa TaxID=46433 RepID=X6P7S1_RETFI|nr:hypothetical protein RFI_03420 [Reticulomyxa filosa]|eukprot:ETO33682.1 hypothetical protein RFI_03420 [Reticulomyxa filosa]